MEVRETWQHTRSENTSQHPKQTDPLPTVRWDEFMMAKADSQQE